MLRLWPERVTVGLFPDQCWIRSRRNSATFATPTAEGDWAQAAFKHAVERIREANSTTARIEILFSDRLARCSLLPWQDQQLSQAQLDLYGKAFFERAGIAVGVDWVMDAGYRHFRAAGLAVAVAAPLLSDLSSIANEHQLSLRRATPMTSLAYWRYSPGLRSRSDMLFLIEPDRLTLMHLDAGRLSVLDVQPVAGDLQVALKRLVQRQRMALPTHVELWCAQPGFTSTDLFADQFPDAKVHVIALGSGGVR